MEVDGTIDFLSGRSNVDGQGRCCHIVVVAYDVNDAETLVNTQELLKG